MAGEVVNKIVGRSQAGEQLIPPEQVKTILQEAPASSVVLSRATKATMSTAKQIQPVLATLPEAYWVNGDTGLKQTTDQTWKDQSMVAEELAAIVPIPDAVIADASIDLWEEIRPRLTEAIGRAIDQAVLFGVNKPTTWPDAIVAGATAVGNVFAVDDKKKITLADATAEGAEALSKQGSSVNGFGSRPGLGWRLRRLKDNDGNYCYGPPSGPGEAANLFGYPLNEARNGAWDATKAELIMADWSKIIVGVRQDMTFELFREGVISDSTGKVVLNLMTQGSKAMRVIMRVGYQVANPLTALEADESKRFPAGVVTPQATSAVVGG